jgi:hypothetical protein
LIEPQFPPNPNPKQEFFKPNAHFFFQAKVHQVKLNPLKRLPNSNLYTQLLLSACNQKLSNPETGKAEIVNILLVPNPKQR